MADCQWFGCLEQPAERFAELGGGQAAAGQVALRVGDGTRQHEQIVVQPIELAARDDQLAVAQRQFASTLTRHPVPLPAFLRTERSGSAGTLPSRQRRPAPSTTGREVSRCPLLRPIRQFRHDANISQRAT